MARPAIAAALTPSERDLMAALGDMFDTAEAVPVSRRRVALLVDAARFDRFLEMLEAVAPCDAEPDADGERSLGSTEGVMCQERWASVDYQDREAENEHYDEAEHTADDGPAFQMDQRQRDVQHLTGRVV